MWEGLEEKLGLGSTWQWVKDAEWQGSGGPAECSGPAFLFLLPCPWVYFLLKLRFLRSTCHTGALRSSRLRFHNFIVVSSLPLAHSLLFL